MKDSVNHWAVILFYKRFGIELEGVRGYILLVPTVGLIGRFAYPILYKRTQSLNRIVIFGFLSCCGAATVLCFCNSVIIVAVCLCLVAMAVALINSGMLATYPMLFSDAGCVSSVSGWMDFATYLGSAISSAAFGVMLSGCNPFFEGMFLCWIGVSLISVLCLMVQSYSRKTKQR